MVSTETSVGNGIFVSPPSPPPWFDEAAFICCCCCCCCSAFTVSPSSSMLFVSSFTDSSGTSLILIASYERMTERKRTKKEDDQLESTHSYNLKLCLVLIRLDSAPQLLAVVATHLLVGESACLVVIGRIVVVVVVGRHGPMIVACWQWREQHLLEQCTVEQTPFHTNRLVAFRLTQQSRRLVFLCSL